MIAEALACFASMVALDFVWARYTLAAAHKRRLAAASYASAIMCFNGIVVLAYTHDPRMLAPAIAGAFIGTWLGVGS